MRLFGKTLGRAKSPSGRPNPMDLDATLTAACHASCHPSNTAAVIVVAELGAVIDPETGDFIAKRYNYWSYHPSINNGGAEMDFNNVPHLVAAFYRGRRVDTNPTSYREGGLGREVPTLSRDEDKQGPEPGERDFGGELDYK